MRDPFFWSIPLGRVFGITVRVHLLFFVVTLGLILRLALKRDPAYPEGTWLDGVQLAGLLFVSVLLHEFGHCFAARWVDGDATEILMWPLGGLATVDRAAAAARPLHHRRRGASRQPAARRPVRAASGLHDRPGLSAAVEPAGLRLLRFRSVLGRSDLVDVERDEVELRPSRLADRPGSLFWVNWVLFLLNVVLVCFPLDGGRMLQSALWPSLGYRQATLFVIFAGFVFTVVVGLISIVYEEILVFCLAAVHLRLLPHAAVRPGNRRRGGAVRLRFLAGLHQPGARSAAGCRRSRAQLVAALARAPCRAQAPARAGDARGRRTPHGRTAGEDPAAGQAAR